VYGRVTGTGTSCSPLLHSSVREDCRCFWFAVPFLVCSVSIPTVTDECAKVLAVHVGKLEKVLCGSDETKTTPPM